MLNPPAPRRHERDRPIATVEALTRAAFTVTQEMGVTISPSKVSRIIRRYLAEIRLGKNVDFDAYFMPHSDKTGETAIRNVMASNKKKAPAVQAGASSESNNHEGERNV